MHCCGQALKKELRHETRLVQVLVQVSEKIRCAEKSRRKVGKKIPNVQYSLSLTCSLLLYGWKSWNICAIFNFCTEYFEPREVDNSWLFQRWNQLFSTSGCCSQCEGNRHWSKGPVLHINPTFDTAHYWFGGGGYCLICDLQACKFYSSNAAPLGITFIGTDSQARNFGVICKVGSYTELLLFCFIMPEKVTPALTICHSDRR